MALRTVYQRSLINVGHRAQTSQVSRSLTPSDAALTPCPSGVAAALHPIYTAPTAEAAETELLAFADSELGRRYPAPVATWENAWKRIIGER